MTSLWSRGPSQGQGDQEKEGLNLIGNKHQERWDLTQEEAIRSRCLPFFP